MANETLTNPNSLRSFSSNAISAAMPEAEESKRHGVPFAVIAYSLWGIFPLYLKLLSHIMPIEVVAWRCIYGFLTLAVIITIMKRWDKFLDCFRSREKFIKLVLSTTVIVANWCFFLYAIFNGKVLQASMAYYITPLASVLLGVVILHERLRRLQLVSIALAATGVLILTLVAGEFPSLALILAFTFAAYAYLHKTTKGVDSLSGLSVETGFAALLGLFFILFLKQSPLADFFIGNADPIPLTGNDYLLLLPFGTITIVPMLLFITASRRLPLSMIGMLQYITPTLHFILAIFAFGESFSLKQFVCFCFIWLAVTIFLIDARRKRTTPRAEVSKKDLQQETPKHVLQKRHDKLATHHTQPTSARQLP